MTFSFSVVAGFVFACTAAALAAQAGSSQAPADPPKTSTTKLVTLSGCVQDGGAGKDQFTLAGDAKSATAYRLSGTDVRPYVGQHVQIVGRVVTKRLRVVGGLVPSANVAAQGGALDPVQSAISGASASGSPTGTTPLPELRVAAVRPLEGSCPER